MGMPMIFSAVPVLATGSVKAINAGKGQKEERMWAFIESSRRVITLSIVYMSDFSLPYYVTFIRNNEYLEQKIEVKPTSEFSYMP